MAELCDGLGRHCVRSAFTDEQMEQVQQHMPGRAVRRVAGVVCRYRNRMERTRRAPAVLKVGVVKGILWEMD